MASDLILFSGGLDSTTLLAHARVNGTAAFTLSVNYGQRHTRELLAAAHLAEHYDVEHLEVDLTSWGALLGGSALTDRSVRVPHGHYAEEVQRATIVPNRNATLLMAAAGVAVARGCARVVTAVHAGDRAVYPDCRPEFIDAANYAVGLATDERVTIEAPFSDFTKTDIAALAGRLDVPVGLTWSCYEGGAVHCGECGTCVERIEALRDAGVVDPTAYRRLVA